MDAMTPPGMMPEQDDAMPLQAKMAQALIPQPKPVTHDITIVTTRKIAQARVMGVPPEEVGVERGARDIKSCNYFFHDIVTKTAGQLITEGFDKNQINALNEYTGVSEIETLARDSVNEHLGPSSSGVNPSSKLVRITEHYVRMDYEGKNKPCLYMVITGGKGGEILKKDGKDCIYPIDVIPFATTTPIPIPHRFFGRSVADMVMPAQREKTALKRGALDNLYLHNNPRVEIAEANAGPNTLDDLLVSRPGGVVRTKTPGGMNWQVVPDITGSVYPMMQYVDAEIEARTGLSKQTQGIDANALQNQSATAVAQVFSASQMRLKLIARNFAEGVRDIFSLLHHTIRSHGQEEQTFRLRNKWIPVNPRNWKTRDDMTINVGIGGGGKAQQFAQTMAIANFQKELLLGGKANLVDDTGLFNTASELARIAGHKNPDKFFNDPTAKDEQGQPLHPPVPPAPSPEAIKAQSQMQIEQIKSQSEQQNLQAKAMLDKQKAELDAFHQKIKAESETSLQMAKHELDKQKALFDAAIKEREDARAHSLHLLEMQIKQESHQHTMRQGELGLVATAQSHDARMAADTQKKKTHESRDLSPVVEQLTMHLQNASKPKRAKRQADGSWIVEPVH